jgi:murein DD-endopeptidase MepM/ murein hydrolase activator NlpD
MSHLRSVLHVGLYTLALLVTFLTLSITDRDRAEAVSSDVAEVAMTSAPVVDPALERELVEREKRVSRSADRRKKERPAPVAKQVVIEKITWTSPLASYDLTSRFGESSYMWSSGMHTGLDFAAPTGTPIRSIAAGTVKSASYDGSYGYKTVVSLPGGGEVWYCHQNSLGVSPGQRVAVGEVIGSVGATGNVTGDHLHLEIRYGGEPVDPAGVFAGKGVGL